MELVLNVSDDLTVKAFQQGELSSDHYAVHFDITVEKGLVTFQVKQCHKFKSIELDVFKNDLRELFTNKLQDKNDLDGMLVPYS